MALKNIDGCKRFMKNLAAQERSFRSEDERQAFITAFVGDDKRLQSAIKAFIINNFTIKYGEFKNPLWSLKDPELQATMKKAREKYEVKELTQEEKVPVAPTVEPPAAVEVGEQPTVVTNEPVEEQQVEKELPIRVAEPQVVQPSVVLEAVQPPFVAPVVAPAPENDEVIALLRSIQAKQDLIYSEVLEIRELRRHQVEFDGRITAMIRERIPVPPIPRENYAAENQPLAEAAPPAKKMKIKNVTIKEELIERTPNVKPYRRQ